MAKSLEYSIRCGEPGGFGDWGGGHARSVRDTHEISVQLIRHKGQIIGSLVLAPPTHIPEPFAREKTEALGGGLGSEEGVVLSAREGRRA